MKHFIIVKFKEGYDYRADIENIRKLFEQAPDIDGVDRAELRVSSSERENRHDLMIEITLTPEGLRRFDASDLHARWKAEYGSVIAGKVIFDCEG